MKPKTPIVAPFLLVLAALAGQAQFADHFDDGNFTSDPVWSGTDSRFVVESGELRLSAPEEPGEAYLVVLSGAINNAEWKFQVRLDFDPSSANLSRVYLASDSPDLSSALDGYFVLLGDTPDAVSLYRQDSMEITPLIEGTPDRVQSGVTISVKVTRDQQGHWTLADDAALTGEYVSEGEVDDNQFALSSYFGVYCHYTISRHDKFFFDDFDVIGEGFIDEQPPEIDSIDVISADSILLYFSEPVDSITAVVSTNYTVDHNVGSPSTVSFGADLTSISLSFDNGFPNGQELTLEIAGVRDSADNELEGASLSFVYFEPVPAGFKDVVITEIMADPDPAVALPDAEYLELLNRSANPFDLDGWTVSDGTNTGVAPSIILLPGEYLILTGSAQAPLFSGYGDVLGLVGFPGLNNTGDKIVLTDPDLAVVDSTIYSGKTYHNSQKAQGGWSLELIDPDNFCLGHDNWIASTDPAGGTPGKQNAVHAQIIDNKRPWLLNSRATDEHTIHLSFDEPLDSTLPAQNHFAFEPTLSVESISFDGEDLSVVIFQVASITPGVLYSVSINGVHDCSQNTIDPAHNKGFFALPEAAYPGDVVINEILFNPVPGGTDFVEVFNGSEKFIQLDGWFLSNFSDGVPENLHGISNADLLLYPGQYLAFTSDTAKLYAQYPGASRENTRVSSIPYLPDKSGSIALLTPDSAVIDVFSYDENYHTSMLVEGVSLERLNATAKTNDPENWKSASGPFATPGYLNTEPLVPLPVVDTVIVASSSAIDALFSVKLDVNAAEDPSHYEVDHNIGHPLYATMAPDSLKVHLTFERDLENGHHYTLSVTGVANTQGGVMEQSQFDVLYFVPSPVLPKDVVMTEIMADPDPAVIHEWPEYIELFNRSANPVDLAGWTLSDDRTEGSFMHNILLPREYVVVTSASSVRDVFNNAEVVSLHGFPGLNNDGDRLILKGSMRQTIDDLPYDVSWHSDPDKEEGGWSLELIDPDDICSVEDNWTSSADPSGGTPGRENSVVDSRPDRTGPRLLKAVALDERQIVLYFNERLNALLSTPASFSITPQVRIDSVAFYDEHFHDLLLHVDGLVQGTEYILRAVRVFDCPGNKIQTNHSEAHFALPERADPLDIVINEILFNPTSTGADFVELYNRSDKYVNLVGWQIANRSDTSVINGRNLFDSDYLMHPGQIMAFTEEKAILLSEYIRAPAKNIFQVGALPSLPDNQGSVALVDCAGNLIDGLWYNDDMHSAFLKDHEGVSLERLSANEPTQSRDNWKSSAFDNGYATPGYENANSVREPLSGASIDVFPEIFEPERGSPDYTQISYHLDHGGYVGNVAVCDSRGRIVRTIVNNAILGSSGFFRWDGDTDSGTRASLGYYVVLFEIFDDGGRSKSFVHRVIVMNR